MISLDAETSPMYVYHRTARMFWLRARARSIYLRARALRAQPGLHLGFLAGSGYLAPLGVDNLVKCHHTTQGTPRSLLVGGAVSRAHPKPL